MRKKLSDIAIVAENIGKQYRIGAQERRHAYRTLREAISGVFTAPYRAVKSRFNRFSGSSRGDDSQMFWALRHISFEVEHGEAIGVIGRNGAGKSTLLKLLCRVTEPTEGRAVLHGRAGSLLEVGTGFHPELSGRENIYLNGAILGMSKREIDRKFDEIVAFAETEKFLDTQVKHYSTGMYMRLAFAVAAHLEPEVLLIDEVLAVGDAAFQKKCLGKMSSIAQGGRTVLFVSHNMGAINSLCDRTVWIEQGSIVQIGPTEEVTEAYLLRQKASEVGEDRVGYTINRNVLESQAADGITITNVRMSNPESPNIGPRTGEPLVVEIDYACEKEFVSPAFAVRFRDLYGMGLVRLGTKPFSGYEIDHMHRHGRIRLFVPKLPFVAGRYLVDVDFVRPGSGPILKLENVAEIDVELADYYGSGRVPDRTQGVIVLDHSWEHKPMDQAVDADLPN